MSDGGLLQKAMEQQQPTDSEVVSAVIAEDGESDTVPFSKVFTTLFLGAIFDG